MSSKGLAFYEKCESIAKGTIVSGKIIRFFPDADLRAGHEGLKAHARDHKVDAENLKAGEFLVFCNRRQTGVKIYAPGNVVAYLKSPGDYRLDLRTIILIPRFFNGTYFDYNSALKKLFKGEEYGG